MRFGFKMPHQATTWTALADVWRAGDQLDIFESAWTYDHLFAFGVADGEIAIAPDKPMLDGWSLLAALAVQTTRLRIGNLVTCLPVRHPAVLAKMVTTIDEISGGRLELGLGAGWQEQEAVMYGFELGTPRDRLDRLEEGLEVILGLLAGETVDHDGRFFQLQSARIAPVRPRPRVWIGGNGGKRTLRIVARYADAWNYTALRAGGELDAFRAKCAVLAERCAEIGRDPSKVLITAQLSMGGSAAELATDAAAWAEAGAAYAIVMLPERATPSVVEDLAAALAPLRDA